MNMSQDSMPAYSIAERIAAGPMSAFQLAIVFVCQLVNVVDGFDLVIISFTASSIAGDLGLEPEQLGAIFAAGTFGMMIGSLTVAPLADTLGRRPIILSGVTLGALGMFLAAAASDYPTLAAGRGLTGIGIGALFASLTTIAVEYSSARRRDLMVTLLYLGAPVGTTIGGLICVVVMEHASWRMLFMGGGVVTLATLVLVFFTLPESIAFLLTRRRPNSLPRINALLLRMRLPPANDIPPAPPAPVAAPLFRIVGSDYRLSTLSLWVGFFATFVATYFLVSWTPALLEASGLPRQNAMLGGVVLSGGGAVGLLLIGILSNRIGLRRLLSAYMLGALALMVTFALSYQLLDLSGLLAMTFAMGFCTYGAATGLYALAVQAYPVETRTTGLGWAIGMGRWGAVLGPAAAGFFIAAGLSTEISYALLALPLLLGAPLVFSVRTRSA